MTSLAISHRRYQLSRKELRQLNEQLALIEQIEGFANVVYAHQEQLHCYGIFKASQTLEEAGRELKKAKRAGRVTPQTLAAYHYLIDDYLYRVGLIVYDTDVAFLEQFAQFNDRLALSAPDLPRLKSGF